MIVRALALPEEIRFLCIKADDAKLRGRSYGQSHAGSYQNGFDGKRCPE